MTDNSIMQTEAGNRQNQDRGVIISHGSMQVLPVADGAGGISGGGEAAELAVAFARQNVALLDTSAGCISVLHQMDRAVAQARDAGETTCVLAVISEEQVFGASIGDSGAWLITEESFVNLTQGQSQKPFIGSGSARAVGFAQPRMTGEYLLLATDGLLKYAQADRIAAACRAWVDEPSVPRLIELVRYPSGALPDDITYVLARL